MGKGKPLRMANDSLKGAIQLIFEDRLADIRRGLPSDAIESTIAIP
jgi:predicted RNase H-like HicB family nuclease